MPTATFSTADADDGSGRLTGVNYPPTGGFIGDDTTVVSAYRFVSAGTYFVGNGLMRWNVSTIPVGATVVSADMRLYCVDSDMDGTGYSLIADYYDFGGEPTVQADITTDDDNNVISAVALPLAISTLHTITFTDISGIQAAVIAAGTVGVRIKLNNDTTPTQPNNYVDFASSEHATQPAPELRVTYNVAGSGPTPQMGLMGAG